MSLSKAQQGGGQKRSRGANRDKVRRFFALDADTLADEMNHLHTSSTYVLESMGGSLAAWAAQAAANDDMTVIFGTWHYPGDADAAEEDDRDAGNSVLVFNKLYGVSVDVPVRKSDVREQMHMFSAFFPRLRRERLDAREWLHEPLYGGVTDRGENQEPRYVPRPAIMDRLTQNLMYEASSDFGWRALMYESRGDADPYPTGIVALEGFLFKRVAHRYTTASGKQIDSFRAADEDNLETYAERVRQIVEHSKSLVAERREASSAPVTAQAAKSVGEIDERVRVQMDANAAAEPSLETSPSQALDDVMTLD